MSTIEVTNINDISGNASLVTDNGGLKTDKLTGKTTAGSISVVGEGNSTTTNLQQGLIKAWFQFNSDASLQDSINTASCTDNGVGSFTQNHTNNMANSDYAFVAMAGHDNNTLPTATITVMHKAITSGTRVRIHNASGTVVDESQCNGMSSGDLA